MRHCTALILLLALALSAVAQTITVDPNTSGQIMRGWEATAQADQHHASFSSFDDAAFDALVDLGINRIRLEIRSGSENTTDSWSNWEAAGFPTSGANYDTWRAKRYETINDNGDSNSINASGYHFSELDDTIDLVVNPLRTRLAARGESLYVNLNYVSFYSQVTSGEPYVHASAAEYAEFMLATFQHLQSTYGWVPDGLEVMLEPDNVPDPWTGTFVGQVIDATGDKLATNGFTPDFIAASTTLASNAPSYFDALAAVTGALGYLTEFSYHRYDNSCDGGSVDLASITSRATTNSKATSMLEMWCASNSYQILHTDLKTGNNSAWQQGIVLSTAGSGTALVYVDTGDPTNPDPGDVTRYTQQYFRYVRFGAVRKATTSGNGALDALAFRNVGGNYAVIVKATSSQSFTIGGLPAGTYHVRYTTDAAYNQNPGDQAITAGQNISTSIPAAGVLTVFADVSSTSRGIRGKGKVTGKNSVRE